MYVCVCNAVTDREVERAIDGGATTRVEVTRKCGAGGDCGSCHAMIEEMCAKHAEDEKLVAAASLVRERAA